MKILISFIIISCFTLVQDDYENMLDYTGFVQLSEGKKVELKQTKLRQIQSSSPKVEIRFSTKDFESAIKLDSNQTYNFVVKTPKKNSIRLMIVKFEIENGKKVARYFRSLLKPDKNQDFKFIKIATENINLEKGIFKIKISQDIIKGHYAILFGFNDGKKVNVGGLDSNKALFFEII